MESIALGPWFPKEFGVGKRRAQYDLTVVGMNAGIQTRTARGYHERS
jgi:hypothetical protein